MGIRNATGYVYLDQRCSLCWTASLQYQVFDGLIRCIFIDTRVEHLTADGDGFLFVALLAAGNVDDILVLQRNVGRCAFHNAANVDAQHFQSAVVLHTVHNGMLCNSSFGQSVSSLNQSLDGTDVTSHLIHAGTEYGTLHFHHVLIAVQGRVDADRVFVHQAETVHVELVYAED